MQPPLDDSGKSSREAQAIKPLRTRLEEARKRLGIPFQGRYDYYDLWRVLGTYRDQMDLTDFASFVRKKCAVRNVSFDGSANFFQKRMLAYVEKTWEQWLGPLVPGLPPYGIVIGDLQPQIDALLEAS